jgi:hypothetical protein
MLHSLASASEQPSDEFTRSPIRPASNENHYGEVTDKFSTSLRVYIAMILLLAVGAAVLALLPQGDMLSMFPEQEMSASPPVMAVVNFAVMTVLYGGLGLVGLRLAKVLGFAGVWGERSTNRQRLVIPALAGLGLGLFFIVADAGLSRWHSFGPLPHPSFPASLLVSLVAGIGEEVLFRLFFIMLWVWLISHVLFRKRALNAVFGVVTVLSAIVFTISHLPTVTILFGLTNMADIPAALLAELLLLNGSLSVVAALFLRWWGIVAAAGVHFWADVVWHVMWGAFPAAA